MQIEHRPWLPTNADGIEGQKIAIVGYSHYIDDGPDRIDFTSELVQALVDGKYQLSFFKRFKVISASQTPPIFGVASSSSTSCPR